MKSHLNISFPANMSQIRDYTETDEVKLNNTHNFYMCRRNFRFII